MSFNILHALKVVDSCCIQADTRAIPVDPASPDYLSATLPTGWYDMVPPPDNYARRLRRHSSFFRMPDPQTNPVTDNFFIVYP